MINPKFAWWLEYYKTKWRARISNQCICICCILECVCILNDIVKNHTISFLKNKYLLTVGEGNLIFFIRALFALFCKAIFNWIHVFYTNATICMNCLVTENLNMYLSQRGYYGLLCKFKVINFLKITVRIIK